ncbi:Transcription factor GATA-5 [Haplosporangium gracile]|nr:Transcription factor GATA-5 [Haplosporangium gracile]
MILLGDDENTLSPHVSSKQPSVFSPSVGQVKTEEDTAAGISCQSAEGLALIPNEELNQSGQAEGEEPTYVIISPQSTGAPGGILSDEAWTHFGQATTSSDSLVSYTPVQYQHQAQQEQQSSFGTLIQQSQPHTTQAPLPGIKEISGFYQSVPLPGSSMLDRSHYAIGPQGAHHAPAQYIGLYNTAHYASAPEMGLLSMPHPYPIPMGFHEIPLSRRRRERRHHQTPCGTSSHHDPSRQQQSRLKAVDLSGANELLESPSMTIRSESFKQERDTAVSEGPQSNRRHAVQDRDPDPKACNNCQTTTTPSWRRCPKGRILLCNACGLYQKLHGKSRPHYLAKDGTIKVQRIVPEHAPCVQCHTRTSPTWKKGPKGEAICHACSTTMKLERSQSKGKVPRIEYSSSADMTSVVSESMYPGETSGGEYPEAMAMRGFHPHGFGIGAGGDLASSSSYGDVESVQRWPRSSSTRNSARMTQQGGYFVDHSARSGVNQYQSNRSLVYGFGQFGPAYGLAQYGEYDTSGYSLANLHAAYPLSPGGWQPEVAAYSSGTYPHASGPFTFESSPPQQGQSFHQQREAMGLLRMGSSSSALPASTQSPPEGQQLLVPYRRPTQASYLAWGQAQQPRPPQSSLHSAVWGAGGNEGSGGPALGMSSDVSSQDQQQQHRMFLINQRSGSTNSRQDLLSQGLSHFATTIASSEAAVLRLDRHKAQQHAHHEPLMHHQAHYLQQQQEHSQAHPYSSYPASIPARSHSPSQDQKNRDYEAALQSYVQAGGSDDAGMPSHPVTMGGATVDATVEQVTGAAGATSAVANPGLKKDSSSSSADQEGFIDDPYSNDDRDKMTKSESNLEAMAVETLANTFFDRQNSTTTAPSPVSESGLSLHSAAAATATSTTMSTAYTPVVVTEVQRQKKSNGPAIVDVEGKALSSSSSLESHKLLQQQYQQQHEPTAPSTSAQRSGRNTSTPTAAPASTSTSAASAIPEEAGSGEGGSGGHRPRRSERSRATPAGASASAPSAAGAVAPKAVKKQEGLMSQHLNRRH